MNQEEEIIMQQAQAAIEAQQAQAASMGIQSNAQNQVIEENEKSLAGEQLELGEELEKIEHLLRGHIIKRDEQGIQYWDEPEDDNFKPLNDYGVRILMKTISMYLSKRKLLSNYNEEQIAKRMEDFGIEIADLIFMKYREMGLDTDDKKKLYPIIVNEIVDAVEDVYNRALGGKERDSIRKHWNIQESMGGMNNPAMNQKRNGMFNMFGR